MSGCVAENVLILLGTIQFLVQHMQLVVPCQNVSELCLMLFNINIFGIWLAFFFLITSSCSSSFTLGDVHAIKKSLWLCPSFCECLLQVTVCITGQVLIEGQFRLLYGWQEIKWNSCAIESRSIFEGISVSVNVSLSFFFFWVCLCSVIYSNTICIQDLYREHNQYWGF